MREATIDVQVGAPALVGISRLQLATVTLPRLRSPPYSWRRFTERGTKQMLGLAYCNARVPLLLHLAKGKAYRCARRQADHALTRGTSSSTA